MREGEMGSGCQGRGEAKLRITRGFQFVWLGGECGDGEAIGPEEAEEGRAGLGRKVIRLGSWPQVHPCSGW